ncbi:sensor histidine kinase [Aeromicrobium alkaliterrae]|uniref:histidine kinase n=1 Tax=Aeromicrobium alkaliterrae TaxID=302168 RepID=A0ABN2JID8_9ACTN
MVNRESEVWASAVLTVLVVALAVPVALLPEGVTGPVGLWWVAYVAQLVGVLGVLWFAELLPRAWQLAALGLLVSSAWALVLLAPFTGWMPFVLILAASASVHLLTPRGVGAVIAVGSAFLLVGLLLTDVPAGYVAMMVVLYTLIMVVSALSDRAQLVVQRNRTELAVLNTELRSTQALLEESSRADERLRISRDLHDVMGHQLTALILELEVASHRTDGEAHEHVVTARGIARDLMDDVRSTVADQRSVPPDLATALHQVAGGATGLDVTLTVEAELPTDGPAFTALVRCAQEVVTNALRHAQATRLWIDVSCTDGLIVLTAQDDGVGSRTLVPGNGLAGICERTEELGGSAEFRSHDGFLVTARVPAA